MEAGEFLHGSVQLTGWPGGLKYPKICANCGSPATEWLEVRKVFSRSNSDGPNETVIGQAHVPFCPGCVAQHRSEAKVISPLKRLLLCFRAPVIVSSIGSGFMAYLVAPAMLRTMFSGDLLMSLVSTAGLGFFVAICVVCFRAAYVETERHAVIPPTSVTSAFEFTDDKSDLFEPERREYTIRNAAFAEAFALLNRDQVWQPRGPQARKAQQKRKLAYIAFGVLVVVVLTWEWVADFLRHL